MGLTCRRKTYLCQNKHDHATCKHNHDLQDAKYQVIGRTKSLIHYRTSTMILAEKLLGCKPFKGTKDEYYATNCMYNEFVIGGIPPGLAEDGLQIERGVLYDYQHNDLQRYGALDFMLNSNLMGYGKTIEALAYAKLHKCRSILIIVPKSVILQWAKEIKWFWPERTDDISILPKHIIEGKITIVNYDKFSVSRTQVEAYKNFVWDVMICDEAHRIKNRNSMRTISIKSIPAKRRVALTGTPILRRIDDLFSICEWVNPKLFGHSYWNFVDVFANIEESFFGKKITGNTKDEETMENLNNFMKLFTIRNPELSVGEGFREHIVSLEMYPHIAGMYKDLRTNMLERLEEEMTILNAASKMVRLRQLASNPGLFNREYHKWNPKFHWIRDLVNDNPDIKLLVFSCFAQTVSALNEFLAPEECVMYHGEMSTTRREKSVDAFLHDARVRVLAGTVGALGQGVDGLQAVCHIVIFLDRDWSPEINRQAQYRLIRQGQKHITDIYFLECEHTVDQYIGNMNITKMEDVRRILDA